MSEIEFTQTLSKIFEHSSWIPKRTWKQRPFESSFELYEALLDVVEKSTIEEKVKLLRAHPELAGTETNEGTLTTESHNEQSSRGFNLLSHSEQQKIDELNKQYRDQFGFPFIIAVKNNCKQNVFNELQCRIHNNDQVEIKEALSQVAEIARFRLEDLLRDDSNKKRRSM